MPRQTFFNLKEEKRGKIENAAIKEFASFGFHGAGLNSIVREAGIAKGSFYQYFEDLEDLFLHLTVTLARQKMEVIHRELKKHETDNIFTKLTLAQKAAFHFVDNFGEEVMGMLNHPLPAFVYTSAEFKEIKERSEQSFYSPLIKEAIAKGEIVDNEDLAYSVLSHSGAMIRQYLMHKKHTRNISEILKDEKAYNEASYLIINFIKQGLKAGKQEAEK